MDGDDGREAVGAGVNLPIRPTDSAGQRFQTNDPLAIIAFLLDAEGFELVEDRPDLVALGKGEQIIRLTAAGVVTTGGEDAARAARLLLLHSEEG